MSVWYTINLGDAMLEGDSLDRIKAIFLSEYEKVPGCKDMAVFVRHDSEGRLHCEVTVYFSPASVIVAKAVDAIPCNRPSPDGLGSLAGSEQCWSVLFAGNDSLTPN